MPSTTDEPRRRAAPAEAAPERGRQTRAQEEQVRRRRRDPNDNGQTKRLAVPEANLDRDAYQYRWVNDTPGRIKMLHDQDWDLVEDGELGDGFTAERHADVAQNRVALTTRLMRKPKSFFEEDHAIRQKKIDEELQAAELGRPLSDNEGLRGGDARVYTPNLANNKL